MADGVTYDALWDVAWDDAAATGPGFRSRYAILLGLMARYGVSGRLLEVGAGRGHFLRTAHKRFPWLSLTAHEQAPRALDHLRSLDFLDAVLDGELDESGELGHAGFHAVVCSEVLEHIVDDERALDAMVARLRPGGRLFLTVPLRADLWTKVDDAVGHQRRYEKGALAGLCSERGLDVEEDLAIGFPLYNAYYKALGNKTPQEAAHAPGAGNPLAGLAKRVLARLFTLEARFDSPWGGRGVVVARKPIPPGARGS